MPFGVMLITRKKDSAGETKMTDAKAVNGGEAQEINKHVYACSFGIVSAQDSR